MTAETTARPATGHRGFLHGDRAHVWWTSLDLEASSAVDVARHLSGDERERAARFVFQRDATRFMVSRAVLRLGLAEYLGVEPGLIAFRYGEHGKPELAPPFDGSGLYFNASRSQGLGLFAISPGRPVGVDIERLRPLPDLDEIAERVFSAEERRRLHRLPPVERLESFLNCWTRKEAYLKATGAGFAGSPKAFTVSLAPGAPARLEHVEDDPDAPTRWTLEVLHVDPGYVAAIAVGAEKGR